MFLPLASTMSVFNCWAVGVHAEKTFTGSRQVRGRTGGDLGRGQQLGCIQQCSSQSSCVSSHLLRTLLFCLPPHSSEEASSEWVFKGTFPVWSLICWWRGSRSSHPSLSIVMRSLQITSLSPLLPCFAEGWPDSPRFSTAAVVLRQAAVFTQVLSFPPLTPSLLLFSFQSILICGATFFSPALVLFLPPSSPWSRVICRML